MPSSSLGEHAGYLSDQVRLSAYEQALVSLLHGHERTVLDLGAGSGILGLIAARAGARRVYAIDSGSIIGPATEVARQAGLAERIVHIQARSGEITLPHRVDVAVCDQIGGFVYDAGVLEYFADARRRFLATDGKLVPAGFRMFLAPAECSVVREQIDMWRSSPAGFDFSTFRDLAVNAEHRVGGDQVRLLGPCVEIAQIRSDHTDPIKGGGAVTIETDGQCDGLVGWFEAEMGGGAMLTNRPGSPDRMSRWCNLYPTSESVRTRRGDTAELHADVRPALYTVNWSVKITTPNGMIATNERHSTLLARLLSRDDLVRAGGARVDATPVGRFVARALDLADGTRSTEEVIAELGREQPNALPCQSFEQTLRQILGRFAKPTSSHET